MTEKAAFHALLFLFGSIVYNLHKLYTLYTLFKLYKVYNEKQAENGLKTL